MYEKKMQEMYKRVIATLKPYVQTICAMLLSGYDRLNISDYI